MKKKRVLRKWVVIVLEFMMIMGFATLVFTPLFAQSMRIGGEHFLIIIAMIVLPALILDKYYW